MLYRSPLILLGLVQFAFANDAHADPTMRPAPRRGLGLLQYQTNVGDLPIMEALAEGSKYTDTTAYIYDTADDKVEFDNWLQSRWPNTKIDQNVVDRVLDEMTLLSRSWAVSLNMNCDWVGSLTNDPPVYNDTTLVVPLGGAKILWSWLLLRSALTSSVFPKTVLLVTGLNKGMDTPIKFVILHQFIKQHIIPHLPKQTDLKWAVFEGPGNAGISRAIGGRLTNTTYLVYHDADDVLGHSAIEMKIEALRHNPDVAQVLGAYVGCESSTEHIDRVADFLEDEAGEDRPVYKLLALDDLSRAYCETRYNVTEHLMFDKDFAENEVMRSFSYKGTTDLKDVNNWPQLRWFNDCNRALDLIEATEKKYQLSEVEREAEAKAVQWFKDTCGNRELDPEYVGTCHNGWGAIKSDVMKTLPLVYPNFGEDSMLTFMVSHSNRKSICLNDSTGGVYVMYRRSDAVPVGDEIFPSVL